MYPLEQKQNEDFEKSERKLFADILLRTILLVAVLPLPLYYFLQLSIFSVEITDYFSFWYFMLFYTVLLFLVPTKNIKNNALFSLIFGFWSIASVFVVDYFFTSVTFHGFSYFIIPVFLWICICCIQISIRFSKKTPK